MDGSGLVRVVCRSSATFRQFCGVLQSDGVWLKSAVSGPATHPNFVESEQVCPISSGSISDVRWSCARLSQPKASFGAGVSSKRMRTCTGEWYFLFEILSSIRAFYLKIILEVTHINSSTFAPVGLKYFLLITQNVAYKSLCEGLLSLQRLSQLKICLNHNQMSFRSISRAPLVIGEPFESGPSNDILAFNRL